MSDETLTLRRRDFWTALFLMALSLFFLWQTLEIPFGNTNNAGIDRIRWYDSAAVVPFALFCALFVLGAVLLVIAIRAGALSGRARIGWNGAEALRFVTIGICLLAYIGALVPRVDFILASALLIACLIHGYHGGHPARMRLAAGVMGLAGVFSFAVYPAQADWRALGDDWLVLVLLVVLLVWTQVGAKGDKVARAIPWVALLAPTLLICAMAFGFRQNVPARTGLIFGQIEYHYYVTLRPLWRD